MGKSSPEAAPAPDPYATARAQTGSNVSTAVANTVLGNANETGPLGSVRYQQNGSYRLGEPVLDAQGNPTTTRRWVADSSAGATPSDPNNRVLSHFDAENNPVYRDSSTGGAWNSTSSQGGGRWVEDQAMSYRDIPQWERITTLSPTEQALYDKQSGVKQTLLDVAQSQSNRLQETLGKPLSFDNVPDYTRDVLARILADDGSASRIRVEDALSQRLNPQLDRDRAALENQLVNQGFTRGAEGFNNEMDSANRQANDARLGVIAAGGQEQALQQSLMMQQLSAAGTSRDRSIQELMAQRNAPINEISALLGQSQVSMPQFSPYQGGTVAGTPVGDYVYKSADINQKNYAAETAANASSLGGLFSLGGSALGGLFGMPGVQTFLGAGKK
jgi:hypothetical protein